MIWVRRDANLIPQKVLDVAQRAQQELEGLPTADRPEFIRKKSHVWRAFGKYLSKMSYGKCWYSESPDPQSFFDVDHYRPKLEAKRSDTEADSPAYEWLAFSWDNFRYAANCSNRLRENIDTGVVEGKGSWFPLLSGSPKATWGNRCEARELPVLLDPVVAKDADLIEVKADGRMGPTRLAVGDGVHRVERSCEIYSLNHPAIVGARKRVMREVLGLVQALNETLDAANLPEAVAAVANALPVTRHCEMIREKTKAGSPYSKAARSVVNAAGWAELCAGTEYSPNDLAA